MAEPSQRSPTCPREADCNRKWLHDATDCKSICLRLHATCNIHSIVSSQIVMYGDCACRKTPRRTINPRMVEEYAYHGNQKNDCGLGLNRPEIDFFVVSPLPPIALGRLENRARKGGCLNRPETDFFSCKGRPGRPLTLQSKHAKISVF